MSKGKNNKTRMREELKRRREYGQESVEWKLSDEQLSFVQDEMRLKATPSLYEIATKRIVTTQQGCHILKTVCNAFVKGRKRLYLRLADYEVEALKQAGVQFKPFKYRIDLMST